MQSSTGLAKQAEDGPSSIFLQVQRISDISRGEDTSFFGIRLSAWQTILLPAGYGPWLFAGN